MQFMTYGEAGQKSLPQAFFANFCSFLRALSPQRAGSLFTLLVSAIPPLYILTSELEPRLTKQYAVLVLEKIPVRF